MTETASDTMSHVAKTSHQSHPATPSDSDIPATDVAEDVATEATATTTKPATLSQRLRHALAERRDMMSQLVAAGDSPAMRLTLNGGLAFVAVANFILSFTGLWDFAHRVMHYDTWMAPLVPIAIDGATICAISGMYRMRNAKMRIRAYMWFAYSVPTVCSIAGNIAHATYRHFETPAIIGSAAFPILLSLFVHFAIVVNRGAERAKHHVAKKRHDVVATSATRNSASDVPATSGVVKRATSATRATVSDSDTVATLHTTQLATKRSDKELARKLATEHATVSDILIHMSLDPDDKTARRRIERWTADIRKAA